MTRVARAGELRMRDYDEEYKDGERKYAYDFDGVLRRYIMRTFLPFLIPGRGLELGCYEGEFTTLLKQHYNDLTVVEASNELVHRARERVGTDVNFVHSTFEAFE